MDLETENRIATILLKEAAERRRQAENEGVLTYLHQPHVRARPNSRFLTATVLGVQQANRAVEVNEMWRARQKECELDNQLRGKSREDRRYSSSERGSTNSGSTSRINVSSDDNDWVSCSRSKNDSASCYSRDEEGLRDEELEEFLRSRVKRGRGSVGSRMDETGPYLPPCPDSRDQFTSRDIREHRVVLGPEKPSSLKLDESSDEEIRGDRKRKAKVHSGGSSKRHCKRHGSKDKKKNRKEKKISKHHK